ncbi:hypothetical protein SARC_06671 [Sphaeroforma arctica JP610]|uniref:Peptidase M3A/M3B catalytic domain-containing protein n=1 Tax=Sphaeroforma arctica JP610 TaxID=667725 RepID=A0A0L0FVV1_9EUKA|nr:hypothetical protein SARC_06671 [Sphaeroforma arctica JP610]KNC80975.1 hypothetical protein SARC_06671 [Sphaeroforma arctica JP610]|eukprot:XP_014154877.1 hypothetical protein SARC_06671 [Sphaeroforma arctica JP610]
MLVCHSLGWRVSSLKLVLDGLRLRAQPRMRIHSQSCTSTSQPKRVQNSCPAHMVSYAAQCRKLPCLSASVHTRMLHASARANHAQPLQSPPDGSNPLTLRSAFSYTYYSQHTHLNNTHANITGIFNLPVLKTSDGFQTFADEALRESEALRMQIAQCAPGVHVVELMDALSDTLCAVVDLAEFVRNIHPDIEFRSACEDVCRRIHAHFEELNTDTRLSDALRRVVALREFDTFDYEVQRTATLLLFDFEQSAIDGSRKEREAVQELTARVNQLGLQFVHNTQTERGRVTIPLNEARVLPAQTIARLPHVRDKKGAMSVAVHTPSYQAEMLLATSANANVRKALYTANTPESQPRREVLMGLLQARHALALTTGHASYAHKALKDTMAEQPERVTAFLTSIADAFLPERTAEMQQLSRLKHTHEHTNQGEGTTQEGLKAWDKAYYSEIRRTQTSSSVGRRGGAMSEYLELGNVFEGLADIHRNLYGVDIVPVHTLPGEVWDPHVVKLKLIEMKGAHETDSVLGYIYADLFTRSGKSDQPSQFTIRSGRRISDTEYQTPIVGLLCSLNAPSRDTPTLLQHHELSTLFHEMGHAVHCILGRTRFHHVAGTRCKIDYVEIPSIMNEFFVWDYRVLSRFAKHHRTGETVPVGLLEGLKREKQLNAASETLSQVLYALGDQVLHNATHHSHNRPVDSLTHKVTGYEHVDGSVWELYFSHMYTYGASYYTYLWSKAFANLIWQECFSANPLSREVGERYRDNMLAPGGGGKPWVMVERMLGYKPTLTHLVESVVKGHTHI